MARTKQAARKREPEEEKKNENDEPPQDNTKKRRRTEGGAHEYTMDWTQFGQFQNRPCRVVGVTPATRVSDEPVDDALVAPGRRMLDALLASDSVGPWREDADAGRVRAEQVAASMSKPSESVQPRVYCSSSSSSSSPCLV